MPDTIDWSTYQPITQSSPADEPKVDWSKFSPIQAPSKPGVLSNLFTDLTTTPPPPGPLPKFQPPSIEDINAPGIRPQTFAERLRGSQVGQALLGAEVPTGRGSPGEIGIAQLATAAPFPFTPGPETVAGKFLLGWFVTKFALQQPDAIAGIKSSIERKDWPELRKQVGDEAFSLAFNALAAHGLLGVKAGVGDRSIIDIPNAKVERVEPEQPVTSPAQQIPGELQTQKEPITQQPSRPSPTKPAVPETADIQQLLPELTEPAPVAQPKELATYEDFVSDLKQRGTADMTKDQIRALYPQLRMSREVAGRLGRAAFGDQWKGTINASTIRTDQGQLPPAGIPAAQSQVDSGGNLQQTTPGQPTAPGPSQEKTDVHAEAPPIGELLKRAPGEITPTEIHGLSDEDASTLFRANGQRKTATQHDAVLAGLKLTAQDVPELQRMRDEAHKKAMDALQAGNNVAFFSNSGKVVWFNGAIEGATRSGPNHEVVTGSTLPATPPGPPAVSPPSPQPPAPQPSSPGLIPPPVTPGSPTTEASPDDNTQVTPAMQAADRLVHLVQAAHNGQTITKAQVHDIMAATHGGTLAQGKFTSKDQSDVLEMAVNLWVNMHLREFNPNTANAQQAQAIISSLKSLISKLPTQTTRTPETDQMQQFSTPPTEAFVANWVANPGPDDVMLEPSAGLAGLAVFAKNSGARVIVNELSPRRRAMLEQMGIADDVTGYNAELLHPMLAPAIRAGQIPHPTVVVMNPPFSAGAFSGVKRTLIGAQHVEQALKLLPPGGRLVAIVGEGMAMGRSNFVTWWNKIAKTHNIRANITVSGKEYRKYGTVWDNQLIVIDNTGPTTDLGNVVTGRVEKVEDLIPLLEPIRNDRPSPQPPSAQPSGPAPNSTGPTPTIRPGPGDVPPTVGTGGSGERGPASPGPRPATPGVGGLRPQPAPPTISAPRVTGPTGPGGPPTQTPPVPSGPHQPLFEGGDAGITVEQKELADRQLSDIGVYSDYSPQKVHIPGAQPHPTPLVESTAMAAVEPVNPKYTPLLPRKLIEEGHLSNAQLEQVVYAGQAHENELPTGERQGYFIGDGTGLGKGRELAGIAIDNWNHGRKKMLWITAKSGLFKDTQRDLGDLGFDLKNLVNGVPKGGKEITGRKEGIIFLTYSALISKYDGLDAHVSKGATAKLLPPEDPAKPSRMHLIYDFLGPDFDGVIAFDEAHYAGNAVDIKGSRGVKRASARGTMVLDLQQLYPHARVVYSSATGATDVTNLSYADRLGIWGAGTPFPNKTAFFNAIQSGGLSAMEIVARDLKATGKYLARTLSFEGVTYEPMVHELTPEQIQIYDDLSRAWQLVLENRDSTMAITGQVNNGRARGAANSRLYGAQQRFYNQLITSIQMPTILARIKKSLAEGNAPMVSIVNTNESTLNRELAQRSAEADEGEDWVEDLDLSPKKLLLEYVDKHYPTQQFEPVIDERGNQKWQPVVDAQGNPVHNPEAVEAKQKLMDHINLLRAPRNPLEMILDTFGSENVAEVTGRSKRVVQKLQADGTRKAVVEHRSQADREHEALEFLDDKRKILIRSDAGGTGFSFQASKKYKNFRRRDDILAQAGWRADNVLQTMGRSHRSDQDSAPNYIAASTNLSGHKRFISTIMRRLSELGALTGGERKASSRGVFDESNNLENAYAEAGVVTFFRRLYNGDLQGLSFDELCRKMGFTYKFLNSQTGEMETVNKLIGQESGVLNVDEIPGVHTFLNRLLVLEVALQNNVFNSFDQIRQAMIDNAKADGSYDPGTQTVRALEIRKVKDETVYQDPNSTARTRLVEIESDHSSKLIAWDKRESIASDRRVIEYVQNIRSGKIFALKEGPQKTLENGQVVDQWRRIHPTGQEIVQRSTIVTRSIPGSPANFRSVSSEEAEKIWHEEIAKAPKVKTAKDTYLVGAMLPIWDRIKLPRPRIWRMRTKDGENLLGVHIPEPMVEGLRDRLGAGAGEQPSPKVVYERVLDHKTPVELANGWVIKWSRVQNEPRIEVRNVQENQMEEFTRFIGGFIERINYEPRFFIPTDEDAALQSLSKILTKSPVVTRRGGQAGQPGTGWFDRASEAIGLGRLSGAPTLEDIRASRAAELNGGLVAEPLIGPHLRYSGVPFPMTRAQFQDFVLGLEQVSAQARDFWRSYLSMAQAPRITDADRLSGEAGVRYAQAGYVARQVGLQFAGKVMAGVTDSQFDVKLGAAVSEDNLRDLKQRNLDLADEVAHRDEHIESARLEIENWTESARNGDSDARTIIQDLRRRIDQLESYEPEDEARFLKLAENTFSFIGKPGSPFASERDYLNFLASPEAKVALDRHRNLWREQKDPLFRIANDLDPETALETRGIKTGARINLKPVRTQEEDSKTTVGKRPGRSPLIRQTATLRRRDPFGLRAEGQAPAYESSYTELMANGFEREYPVGAQHDFINTMIQNGIAVVSDQEFPKGFEIHGEATKGYLLKLKPWRGRFLQIPKSLAPEYEAITGLKPAATIPYFTKFSSFLTKQSIIGFAEGSTHMTNLLMEVFTGLGPAGNPMLNALLKVMFRADLMYRLPQVLIKGMADSREQMLELATIGAAKEPYRGPVMGRFLNLIDRGVRISSDSIFSRMSEAGWVEDTETNRREFINQVGNYNKKLQPAWVRWLRDTHVQPFATAMETFNVMGARRMFGAPGVKATSLRAATALRADIAAGAVGFILLLAFLNYLISGKAEGPKGTRLGSVGWIGEDRKLHQLDLGMLTGWTRGLRITGAQAFIESKRAGLSGESSVRAATRQMGNTVISAGAGPGVQFLSKAITGARPGVPMTQEAKVMPPQDEYSPLKSQMASNIKTAFRQANPIIDSTIAAIEGKPPQEIVQRQFSRYTPRTGMSQETIENLPRIVKNSEINAYADALANESHKVPVGQRPKWLLDRLNQDQLSPEVKARAIIELRRKGAFSYP